MARDDMGEHIAEYVDSPMMTHRLKIGNLLCCRIQGHYGTYQTKMDLSKKGTKTRCSCPSEYWPCKHAFALAETYEVAPETFVDIGQIIKKLQDKDKAELLKIIEKMIESTPETLSTLGIRGFEDTQEEEE